jgi:hypothetical protein
VRATLAQLPLPLSMRMERVRGGSPRRKREKAEQ